MIARYGVFRLLRSIRPTPSRIAIQRRLLNSTAVKPQLQNDNSPQRNTAGRSSGSRKIPNSNGAPETDGPLPSRIRSMMRLVPHPLTIILSRLPSSLLPSGLLVSSFNTITLSPTPYVSFNLKLPSSTYTSIQASRTFVASAISDPRTARDFLLDKESVDYRVALRENVSEGKGRLRKGRGGVWWMRCLFMEKESVVLGDHVVVIGKVVGAGFYGDDSDDGGKAQDSPLIYCEGRYRVAGEAVEAVASTRREEDGRVEQTGEWN